MATTVIFAEILIVGLQALIWIALFLFGIFGLDAKSFSSANLAQWVQLIIVFVLAFAYTIGIFIDRAADSFFSRFDKQTRQKYLGDSFPSVPKMRLYIMSKNATVNKYIDYIRSRSRIARSTAFNLVLILTAFVYIYFNRPSLNINPVQFISIDIVLIIFIILAIFSWQRISKTYYKRLKKGYEILKKDEKAKSKLEEEIEDIGSDKILGSKMTNS